MTAKKFDSFSFVFLPVSGVLFILLFVLGFFAPFWLLGAA